MANRNKTNQKNLNQNHVSQSNPDQNHVSQSNLNENNMSQNNLPQSNPVHAESGLIKTDQNIAIINNLPDLPYSLEEAMSRLRVNIRFLGGDIRKIMVISSVPNEGKSFVALRLWEQFNKVGKNSLLIDGDLRKSVMAEKYQIVRKDGKDLQGTSHYLSEEASIEDVIVHTEHGDLIANVNNVINPSVLIEGKQFQNMLQYAQENYRYAIIDCPPLNLVSDGERIGSFCDGAVLCIRSGETPRGMVQEAVSQLQRAGCPILGFVLTRAEGSRSGYYSKHYSSHYGKYYGQYGDTKKNDK